MKRAILPFLFVLMLITLAGCSGNADKHVGEAKTPSGSSEQKGRKYQSVVEEFEKKGFTNVKVEKLDDLITGWLSQDGDVKSVSVDGNVDYDADKWYPNDAEVIVIYHTFPEKETESSAESESAKEKNETGNQSESKDDIDTKKVPATEAITKADNADLAKLLSVKSEDYQSIKALSEKLKGQTIEFDGYIFESNKHVDVSILNGKEKVYDTIYDTFPIVGNVEDGDSTLLHGPSMKMERVPTSDFPAILLAKKNVRIVAELIKFDEGNGISSPFLMLKPISIEAR